MVQPIFLAQSGLILPEVMLALFVLLSVYFFLQKKMLLYFISATLMLFTKETGVAIIFIAFILEVIRQRKHITTEPWKVIKILFIIGSPVLVLFSYLGIQYFYHGWFLFPEHTNYISFDIATIFNKFTKGIGAYIFIYQGRNLLFFSTILLLIYGIVRKFNFKYKIELFSLFAFILGFMLVSSLNFFANRYVLSVIPILLLLTIGIIIQVLKNKYIIVGFVVLAIGLQVPILNKQSNSDHNLGYLNAVKANIAMVEYCNNLKIKEKKVFTYFITREVLSNPLTGYVTEEEKYSNLGYDFSTNHDYYIFSNYDTPREQWELREDTNLEFIKRFDFGHSWIELYKSK